MNQAVEKNYELGSLSIAQIAGFMEKTTWATEFSWDQILKICEYVRPLKAKKGTLIFKEGALEQSLGIIIKGSIEVVKLSGDERTRLATLMAPQTFGEMALIDNEPRSASGIALENTIIFFISRECFIDLAREHPSLGFKFLWKISKIISQRLRRTTGKLIDFL